MERDNIFYRHGRAAGDEGMRRSAAPTPRAAPSANGHHADLGLGAKAEEGGGAAWASVVCVRLDSPAPTQRVTAAGHRHQLAVVEPNAAIEHHLSVNSFHFPFLVKLGWEFPDEPSGSACARCQVLVVVVVVVGDVIINCLGRRYRFPHYS